MHGIRTQFLQAIRRKAELCKFLITCFKLEIPYQSDKVQRTAREALSRAGSVS